MGSAFPKAQLIEQKVKKIVVHQLLQSLHSLTSFIASIMIGAITGTLILDKTRKALPRISWFGS